MRQAVKAAYLEHHTQRSNRNAAKRLLEAFAEQIAGTLSKDDPQKQIEKWIAQFRKEAGLPAKRAATAND